MLLLVNYRPEYRHGWGEKTYYRQLRLDPLPPESSGELLDGLIGGDPSLLPLKALLARSTGGNPLFLEESVRTLSSRRCWSASGAPIGWPRPVESVQVPATVQAILAARIDRLPPEEKRLLETAAVIGKDFPFALLQAIADEPDETLRAGSTISRPPSSSTRRSLYPDLEYTFKHALTHEVAYGGMLQDRRRRLHAGCRSHRTVHRDRLEEHVERVAYHALQGGRWPLALHYLTSALAEAFGARRIARPWRHSSRH